MQVRGRSSESVTPPSSAWIWRFGAVSPFVDSLMISSRASCMRAGWGWLRPGAHARGSADWRWRSRDTTTGSRCTVDVSWDQSQFLSVTKCDRCYNESQVRVCITWGFSAAGEMSVRALWIISHEKGENVSIRFSRFVTKCSPTWSTRSAMKCHFVYSCSSYSLVWNCSLS